MNWFLFWNIFTPLFAVVSLGLPTAAGLIYLFVKCTERMEKRK